MRNKTSVKERSFSIELNSRVNLKNVTLTNRTKESVLIEGTIGRLVHARFAEGMILEIVGNKGILRIDVTENEFEKPSVNEVN
jgi:hypothetical protein